MAGKALNVDLMGRPEPKQVEFMTSKTKYTAYGGARGGGKSWAVRRKLVLMAINFPKIRLLLLRKTYEDLKKNHLFILIAELKKIATYKSDDKMFTFKNGSTLTLGYCDNEGDLLHYQGLEYDVIALEEATQYPFDVFDKLKPCLRGGNPEHPKRMYLTCNPGGVGHAWVKRLFIDREFRTRENPEDYKFIKALATDNSHNGDEYINMLNELSDELRSAWRDGNWDSFEGQYFTEWNEDIHTCGDIEIKPHWRKYLVIDYGLDMLAALWIAVDEYDTATVYREVYEGKDNGIIGGHIVSEAARLIKEAEINEPDAKKIIRYAPSDLWAKKSNTGKTTIDEFREAGLNFIKADRNREAGWLCVKARLFIDKETKKAKIRFVKSQCPNIIKFLPLMQFDKDKQNDCSDKPHEITHAPDALRYFCIMRPHKVRVPMENKIISDPFGINKPKTNGLLGGQASKSLLGGNFKI
jgi:phage terminase large subunit